MIEVPAQVGHLVPAAGNLNGPSGRALDNKFLTPLGLTRHDTWLCDLVPYSCINPKQSAAIEENYMPFVHQGILPEPDWGPVPGVLATPERLQEIEDELIESDADIIITLGDLPLEWFAHHYGAPNNLRDYGQNEILYGQLHPIAIQDRNIHLLPLVHPRQAAGLGFHAPVWRNLHLHWINNTAGGLADQIVD